VTDVIGEEVHLDAVSRLQRGPIRDTGIGDDRIQRACHIVDGANGGGDGP